jgi:DNA primase
MASSNPISFKELKQRISLEHVLRHYNLFDTLHLKGKSHRGPCPFCETKEGNPFSVSLEKGCFQCFTCKASGNILDLVSRWEGVSIREAGQVLTKNFVDEKAPPPAAKSVEKTTEREAPPAKKAGERTDKALDAQTPAAVLSQDEILSRNGPLPLPSRTLSQTIRA